MQELNQHYQNIEILKKQIEMLLIKINSLFKKLKDLNNYQNKNIWNYYKHQKEMNYQNLNKKL